MEPVTKLVRRLRRSFAYRRRWSEIGVYFLRSGGFSVRTVRLNGVVVRLRFPEGERDMLTSELLQIFYHDCYGLRTLSNQPASILDIGGNVGLFSMVARHYFPAAEIHCYEPNPALSEILAFHLSPLGVRRFPEAVGRHAAQIKLKAGDDSLHSVAVTASEGDLRQASLAEALARIGGTADLLKLDCEGSEWEILEDTE